MSDWFKNNRYIGLAIFLVGIYVCLQVARSLIGVNSTRSTISTSEIDFAGSNVLMAPYQKDFAPQTDSVSRMVIQESNMSLLVKDVVETRNSILDYATTNGGYMVSVSTSNPQDAPTASITIRVPEAKLLQTLEYLRSLSIKVVSENLNGRDVTDQYVDVDTKIAQIERTLTRLEAILNEATEINDIANLTNQILSYQNQIDSLKGQQLSLVKNAELAKLTLYLSTDEIALPYAPSETFRPAVIFKLAVRSLVGDLRKVSTVIIWLVVYAVVWIPVLGIFIFVKKLIRNWNDKNNPRV